MFDLKTLKKDFLRTFYYEIKVFDKDGDLSLGP